MRIRIDDGDTMLPIEVPDERVNASSRVVIGFPDRVKGGFQPTAHRRLAIPSTLEESMRAGVKDERITLVCGIGLHRKNTMEEFAAVAVPRPDPHDRPGDRAMRMLVVPEVSRPAVQVRSEEA